MNPTIKQCQNCNQSFTIEFDDFAFYKKIDVPPPTFCPECRMIRRGAVRNESNLYHNICALCHKKIISTYSSESGFYVYCRECFISDAWNPEDYAHEYNFSQPFFLQYAEFLRKVPVQALINMGNCINAEYSQYVFDCKNVYLSYSLTDSEDIYYARNVDTSRNVFDSFIVKNVDSVYENIHCANNFNVFFAQFSSNCLDSWFLYDCINCTNCILCSNLRNKQYCFKNTQYTKNEFEKIKNDMITDNFDRFSEMQDEFHKLKQKAIHKFAEATSIQHATGDRMNNLSYCNYCFDTYNSENVSYANRVGNAKDCRDVWGSLNGERIYETHGAGTRSYNLKFGLLSGFYQDCEFVHLCTNVKNVFACASLKNKEYCIFNKQYTKEAYEILVQKIKQHMMDMPFIDNKGRAYTYGEYYPIELSPFAYNESVAMDYFPITKQMALEEGYRWYEKEKTTHTVTFKKNNFPDNLHGFKKDIILSAIFECDNANSNKHGCTDAFKIIDPEYNFYKKHKLPIPRLCPNCRYYARLEQINPLKLWHRTCMNKGCNNEFETSYSPDRQEKIYCENCYLSEIV